MRTPRLRVSLILCFNLLCSAAPTTMANPECPIIDLIDDGSSTTTIDTEAAATLPNPAASTPEAGPAPGTPEWLRRPNTVQQRHSGSNYPVCLCAVDPAGQGPESCFQWPVCDHQLHLGCMAHLLTHYDRPAFMPRLPQPMGTRARGPTQRAMPPARVPSAAATPHTVQQSEHAHSRDHGSTATTRAHRHPVLPPPFVDRPRQRRTR